VSAPSSPFKHRHPELVSGSIGRFAPPERWKPQTQSKINPMRVMFVDKVNLPRAMPVFQLFLTQDSVLHVAKHFEMDQPINRISGSKTGRRLISVLPNARNQIRRYTNAQRAIRLAGKDIDARLFFLSHRRSLAAKWTLKQVQGDGNFDKNGISFTQRHPELVSGSIGRFILFLRLALKRAAK
jgi:hypothetical protein